MIRPALGLEVRNLLRSPLRLLVLLLVLGTGVFVILQGQQDVQRWQEAIEAGQSAQDESLNEARGYFAAGEKGPADRSWIDLSQPRWQDYYGAVRIARTPEPLAGIAFASAESGAVTMRVNRWADPLVAAGNRIENPALAVSGGLDLVAVLALLLPLLIMSMGVEIGGYERATGLLPLVRMQSGHDRSWIWARCVAVGLITAAVGLALIALTVALTNATLADVVPLTLLVNAYVAFWTALLGGVAILARNPSQGAVALGTGWILLCVLIPSLGSERSAAIAADDFALDLTVEARDEGSASRELGENELYDAVFARFPGLVDKAPEKRSSGVRAAHDGMRVVSMEERMQSRDERGALHRNLVSAVSLASPTLAFSHALEDLAGRGPAAAQTFRAAVADAVAVRIESLIAATWSGQPLAEEDFEAMIAASATRVESPPSAWATSLPTLLAWAVALIGGATLLARKLNR